MTTILIVEDEESLADPLAFLLRKEGFEPIIAHDGPTALEKFAANDIDIVLLDLMLPGMSGTEVCKQLRTTSSVPVIMVTARDSEIDKVARIRAVLRRGHDSGAGADTEVEEEAADQILEGGRVKMDVERHTVTVADEPVSMPLKEFDLLEYLLRNAGRVLTRGQLIARIWGADYVGDTKTLDVHVKRLRSKIEEQPSRPKHLVTVRGLGYKFEL